MSIQPQEARPWLFDDFAEGQALGVIEIGIDEERVALWEAIYGDCGDAIPQGLLTAAMMEAYLRVIPRRPPGNIHASQKLAFTDRRARRGARLTFDFSCLSATRKRGRGWVTLGVQCAEAGRTLMHGEIQTIWAR